MTRDWGLGFIPPMRLLSCLALITTAAVLPAQDFDFKGVPADYAITFASSTTHSLKLYDSPEGKAFKARVKERMTAKTGAMPNSSLEKQEAFKAATGIDPESNDIRYAGGFSMNAAGQFAGGLIIRIAHDSRKLAAFATEKKLPSLQAGAFKGWDGKEFLSSVSPEVATAVKMFPVGAKSDSTNSEPIGVFDIDTNTLVIAQPKEAAHIIAALKGEIPSYVHPSALTPKFAATGQANVLLSVNGSQLPASFETTKNGFVTGLLAIGENNPDFVMEISASFASKEQTDKFAKQAQGLMAFLPMVVAVDPAKPQTAEDKATKEFLGDIISGVQPLEVTDNQVAVTLKWDAKKYFSMLEKSLALGETMQAKLAKNANSVPPPAKKK